MYFNDKIFPNTQYRHNKNIVIIMMMMIILLIIIIIIIIITCAKDKEIITSNTSQYVVIRLGCCIVFGCHKMASIKLQSL